MDTLRQMSLREGIKPSQKDVPVFHSAFLSSVRKFGRIHELSMIISYTIKSEGINGVIRQSGMGLEMFKKGKFKLFPRLLRVTGQLKNIFRQTEVKG